MFKRLFIFSFIAFYFATASGMALNLHFCGQRLANVQVNALQAKSCCAKMAGSEDKCCKNKTLKIKISAQQEAASSTKIPQISSIQVFNLAGKWQAGYTAIPDFQNFISPIKPPPQRVPIGLKNCVFRI